MDGADLGQWSADELGRHIGYLPQDVEVFAGTVAQNIGRFDPSASSAELIAAASAAGVHELVLSLPNGYETEIGDGGEALSAGQRQRVGLARALFRDPFLVVLDEPNSNMDAEGEQALLRAILGVRARGGIAIIAAHRALALNAVEFILFLSSGRTVTFGPTEDVLSKLQRRPEGAEPPATVIPLKNAGVTS